MDEITNLARHLLEHENDPAAAHVWAQLATAAALSDIAHAIRGLPGWTNPT